MEKHFPSSKTLIIGLAVILLIRFFSLALYPLMDTTEARYGEMARIMLETHNWVTPMFDYGVPFWGKPPMFTWLSAIGFQLFGVNEFGARAPHVMVGIGILFLVYRFAVFTFKSIRVGIFASTVLVSTASFLIFSGSVMTDTALTFSIGLAMAGFWFAWIKQDHRYGYLFFIGLALGLLSKGPLALVLVGISLFLWLSFTRQWHLLWRRLPWISGTALMLAIATPWYIIAELRTPGFLDYFIVGEHIKRFLVSGWQGDLYGTAHTQPRGMIWVLGIVALLPWTPILLTQFVRKWTKPVSEDAAPHGTLAYLVCWMLAPLILFTMAGNILMSYVMPALPAAALLITYFQVKQPIKRIWYALGIITPSLIIVVVVALNTAIIDKLSDKGLIATWANQPEHLSADLYYAGTKTFSSQYYSRGAIRSMNENESDWLSTQTRPFFIIQSEKSSTVATLPEIWQCSLRDENSKRQLFFCEK